MIEKQGEFLLITVLQKPFPCNHQIFHYYIRVIKLYAGAEMSGNKIESGKKGKFLRILTNHYRLIIFILMWIFLTLLWFSGPENTNPELRYFDFIKEKIKLVHDVFDPSNQFYGAFYTEKNPLQRKK